MHWRPTQLRLSGIRSATRRPTLHTALQQHSLSTQLDLPAKQLPSTPEDENAATRSIIDRWHQTTGRQAPTQDNDFAHLFVAAYGAWARSLDAAGAARLLRRHCGAREFRGMVKHQHDASCGGLQPTQPAACRGGFYLDDTASVKPCPDGAFCMAGQTLSLIHI